MMRYKVYCMQHTCLFTGAQLHHLSHVGLTGRVGDSRQPGGLNWSPYHEDDSKLANNRESVSLKYSLTQIKKGTNYMFIYIQKSTYCMLDRQIDRQIVLLVELIVKFCYLLLSFFSVVVFLFLFNFIFSLVLVILVI